MAGKAKTAGRTRSLLVHDTREDRRTRPRPYSAPHPLKFYTTEEALRRPIYTVHALARIAEGFLWRKAYGRVKPLATEVALLRFYYAVQEVVDFALGGGLHGGRSLAAAEELRGRLRPVQRELEALLPAVDYRFRRKGGFGP